ncbi:hypothetical protein JFL47_12835 [Haemophilus haemoglobinophilus]|nr:hypothetical protein [Canicola haemoglobinophilus]MBN6712090.1 hypothetical protein [Canicola haemoglobinophilus]
MKKNNFLSKMLICLSLLMFQIEPLKAEENKSITLTEKEKIQNIVSFYSENSTFNKSIEIKLNDLDTLAEKEIQFLNDNYEVIMGKLKEYEGVEFRYNNHFFISDKKIFKEIVLPKEVEKEIDLSLFEIGMFNCELCLRLNNLTRLYIKNYNYRKSPLNLNYIFIPAALKDQKNRQYIIADAMVVLSLESISKNTKHTNELINSLMFDTLYNKVNFLDKNTMKKWVKNKKLNVKKYEKEFKDKNNIQVARIVANDIDQFDIKTFPMLVINNKFFILKNAVESMHKNYYNDELSLALLDYVSTLAVLEKKGFISIEFVKE